MFLLVLNLFLRLCERHKTFFSRTWEWEWSDTRSMFCCVGHNWRLSVKLPKKQISVSIIFTAKWWNVFWREDLLLLSPPCRVYMFIYCVSFECLPSRVCNSRLLLYVCFMDDEDFNFFLTRRFDSLRWWFCDECVGELSGIIVMMGFVSEFWKNLFFYIVCGFSLELVWELRVSSAPL